MTFYRFFDRLQFYSCPPKRAAQDHAVLTKENYAFDHCMPVHVKSEDNGFNSRAYLPAQIHNE